MSKLKLFVVFPFLLQIGTANAVSFDCSKAKSYSEKLICSDRELSEQDDELYILYKEAKTKYSDKSEFKKITTSLWNEREKCNSEDCVRDWYEAAKLKYADLKKNTKSNSKTDNTQHEFLSSVLKAQKASKNVKNDMILGGIKVERDLEICKALRNKEVKNWTGTVKLLNANKDGAGVLWVDIADNVTLKTLNNDAPELGIHTLIQPGSELFKKASNLEVGDKVTFSGEFIYTDKQCAAETSITLYGGVSRPEFVFKFSNISQSDKNASYNTSLEEVTREQKEILRKMGDDMNDVDGIKVVSDTENIYAIKNISPVKQWACVEKWGIYNLDKVENKDDAIILNVSAYVNESYKQELRAIFNGEKLSKLIPVDRARIKKFFAPNNTYFMTYAACSNNEYNLVDAYLFISNKERENLSPEAEKATNDMKKKMAAKAYY